MNTGHKVNYQCNLKPKGPTNHVYLFWESYFVLNYVCDNGGMPSSRLLGINLKLILPTG